VTERSKRRLLQRVALGGVSLGIVVASFAFLLPKVADYGDVWGVVKTLSWWWIGALIAATALNLATFAPPWQVALPSLSFLRAMELTQASTALSIVAPGGAAVGAAGSFGMLRTWGFSVADISRAVTLTSLWNQFLNLLFPILAVFLLTITGQQTAALATVAFIGVAVLGVVVAGFVVVLVSGRLAADLGDLAARCVNWARRKIRRGPVNWGGASFERFREDAGEFLERKWYWLTLASLAGSLTVFGVLLVSLRAVGVTSAQVSLVEAFASWALIRIIASIPITPGGFGVVEVGLTGALVGFGGRNAPVVAAVLVYRFLTVVPTLVLGLVSAFTFRRHRPPEVMAPSGVPG
jgi:putative heme transporter